MSQPIRVLHCFGRMDRGGAETYIMNIYRKINRKKVQFDFVVHTNDICAYDDEILSLGGNIYRVPRYKGINLIEYIQAWKNLFNTHNDKWKIIHAHMFTTATIYLRIAKKYGLVTIVHSHSTAAGFGLLSKVKSLVQYPVRYIADYLFACSQSAGEWLYGEKHITNERFRVLNNAIDSKAFSFNLEKRYHKRTEMEIDKKFVIGHIGRFIETKNHEFIVNVFYDVVKKEKDSMLLLVGDGKMRSQIEEKVKKMNLSNNVIFAGIRSDIPDLLQVMDVFLFPSIYEGLPVTLIEAQASGVKCLISDTISQEVKITEEVKFLSLKKSSEYWAETILEYCNGYPRKDTHSMICQAGYDVGENAKWLEDFYLRKNGVIDG